MEVHRGKAGVRFWGMVVFSIGCSIAFSAPIAGQTGDPAKAQMQEMTRRQLQLNGPGAEARRHLRPERRRR